MSHKKTSKLLEKALNNQLNSAKSSYIYQFRK